MKTRGAGVNEVPLWRRLAAEFLGCAFLAALVIGRRAAATRQRTPGDGPRDHQPPA